MNHIFPCLFTPLKVKHLSLKNRIILAPLYVGYGNPDGTVSSETIEHYARRAHGGASLIVVEATSVSSFGNGSKNNLKAYEDAYIPGLSLLACKIKDKGALSCLQIFHAGKYANIPHPLSASPVPFKRTPTITTVPREMSPGDIDNAVQEFALAAKRAQETGFDMVELLGSMGYLITQFLSPLENKRKDHYGGSFENRLRFLLEVLKESKAVTGGNFPIGMRLMADDFLPGGFGLDDAKHLAQELEKRGIDYLSISAGVRESWSIPAVQRKLKEKAGLAYLSEEIKKCIDVPIFAGNRISTPQLAEEIICGGQADGVALGRPLLRDPDFPRKAIKGDDIRECISCFGCLGLWKRGKKVYCIQEKKDPLNPNNSRIIRV